MKPSDQIKDINELYDFSLAPKEENEFPIGWPVKFLYNCAKSEKDKKALDDYFRENYFKEIFELYPYYENEEFSYTTIALSSLEEKRGNYYLYLNSVLDNLCVTLIGKNISNSLNETYSECKKIFRKKVSEFINDIELFIKEKEVFGKKVTVIDIEYADDNMQDYLGRKYDHYSNICKKKKIDFPDNIGDFLKMTINDCRKSMTLINDLEKLCEKPIDIEYIKDKIDIDKFYLTIAITTIKILKQSPDINIRDYLLIFLDKYMSIARKCDDKKFLNTTVLIKTEKNKFKNYTPQMIIEAYDNFLKQNLSFPAIIDRLNGKTTFSDYYTNLDDFIFKSEDGYVANIIGMNQLCFAIDPLKREKFTDLLLEALLSDLIIKLPTIKKEFYENLVFTLTIKDDKSIIIFNSMAILENIFESYTGVEADYSYCDDLFRLEDKEALKEEFIREITKFVEDIEKSSKEDFINIKDKYPAFYERIINEKNKNKYIETTIKEIKKIIEKIDDIIFLADKPLDRSVLESLIDMNDFTLMYANDVLLTIEDGLKKIDNIPEFFSDVKARLNFINQWCKNTQEIFKQNPTFNTGFTAIINDHPIEFSVRSIMKKYEELASLYPDFFTEKIIEEEIKEEKEEPITIDEFFENPKDPKFYKDESLSIDNFIKSIGDLYLPEIIVNGKKGKFISISQINAHSANDNFIGYFKNEYFIDILNRLPNVPDNLLNSITLSGSVDRELNVSLNISFESVLRTFNKYITGELLSSDGCRNLEEFKDKFIESITSYGDLVASAIDGTSTEEENKFLKTRLEEINNQREYQIPFNYDEYLNNTLDLILTLCDAIEEIKKSCSRKITPKDVDRFINKDTYYLEEASSLFIEYKNNIENGNSIKKEDYLLLAKYINAVKELLKHKKYDVVISNYELKEAGYDSFSATQLIEEYDFLININKLYDLDSSPLFNLLKDSEKTKKLVARWKILPKGHIERLSSIKLGQRSYTKKTDSTFSEDYEKVMLRKEFLDSTDCIVIDGENEFKGYRGYYCENGLVIFEMFFTDEDETLPAKSNATYLMNVENFAEMSALSKPEVMDYIKEGNNDVKRIYHTSTWQNRIKLAIEGKKYTEILKDLIKNKIDEQLLEQKEVEHGQSI